MFDDVATGRLPAEPGPGGGMDLATNSLGQLLLILPDGTTHAGVCPVRCFPHSQREEWISLCDEQGRELLLLEDLTVLDSAARALLRRELASREFMPVIERIEAVSAGAEPSHWRVVTDRGATSFVLTTEDQIRRLDPRGAVITDSHGVRYSIPDTQALDPHSRRILRRYL